MLLTFTQMQKAVTAPHPPSVIWLEGEETWFTDVIVQLAEKNILSETEKAFGLQVFYGKDSRADELINYCRQYPMGSSRQLIILKEAQLLDKIEKLENYVRQPSRETILVVAMMGKKLDGKTRFKKFISDPTASAVAVLSSEKLKDSQLRPFITELATRHHRTMESAAMELLEIQIGNDLSRLESEFTKLDIVLGDRRLITASDIEEHVGISREYNALELKNAIVQRNLVKALTIIQYFDANPKAGPLQLLLPPIYGYFAQLQSWHEAKDKSNSRLKGLFYNNPKLMSEAQLACNGFYNKQMVDKAILLCHEYNLKSIGIHTAYGVSNGDLLKELVIKLIH